MQIFCGGGCHILNETKHIIYERLVHIKLSNDAMKGGNI